MTSMPQMIALLNGLGGAASLLVGGAEFLRAELRGEQLPVETSTAISLALLIGAVTFTGSMIAWAKLQEVIGGQFGEMTVMMQYMWQGWACPRSEMCASRSSRSANARRQWSRHGAAICAR